MNFVYFEKYFESVKDCDYPVGEEFMSNLDYIKSSTYIIHDIVETGKSIQLICRGTSGSILAGAIGFLLAERGRCVTIVVSRKTESHHSCNMAGVQNSESVISVVIDDFISQGETIDNILKDMDHCLKKDTYPILCIANYVSKCTLSKDKEVKPLKYNSVNRFKTIICNKPSKE